MSRHTLLQSIFSDPEGLKKFRRGRLQEMVADYLTNKLNGKSTFDAICLTGAQEGEQLQGTYYPIRVRPLDTDESVVPNPCSEKYKDDAGMVKRLIGFHPLAYAERPYGPGQRTPAFGETIKCKFLIAGPNRMGRQMGTRYIVPTGPTNYEYTCANQEFQSLVGIYLGTPQTLLGAFSGGGMMFNGEINLAGGGYVPVEKPNDTIQGKEFIANGIKYLSVPATDAASNAKGLYDSAEASKPGGQGRGFEVSEIGRAWVTENIYLPMIKKYPEKYKNPEKSAKSFGRKLGLKESVVGKGKGESHWSSWFMRNCYINYWHSKKGDKWDQVPLGMDSSNMYDYTADQGYNARKKIEANPEKYIGKICFITFQVNEAPLFPGDSIFNVRGKAPNRYSTFQAYYKQRQPPSHMKVIGPSGNMVYGGNESQKVGRETIKLDANGVLIQKTRKGKLPRFCAIYKRVKIVGKADSGAAATSGE